MTAADGSSLPNPRKIAMYVHTPYQTQSDWSQMLVWFSQFVVHDVTKTASIVHNDGKQKWCRCGSYDPDCFNIPIPYEDYWNKDQKCFAFTRSAPSSYECKLGPREQSNVIPLLFFLCFFIAHGIFFGKKQEADGHRLTFYYRNVLIHISRD